MTLKVETRGPYTGLTDRYSAGVLVCDYSKQKTPPAPDVIRREKEKEQEDAL